MQTEIWKESPIYPHAYEVSNLGRVRSLDKVVRCYPDKTRTMKGRVLTVNVNPNGRGYVILSDNNKQKAIQVHQLVAMCFMPDFVKGMELNHIDGNPLNNTISNLELSNPSHNQLHAVRTGLAKKQSDSRYRNVCHSPGRLSSKKWVASITMNAKTVFWKAFETEVEAAQAVDDYLDSVGDTERLRNFP